VTTGIARIASNFNAFSAYLTLPFTRNSPLKLAVDIAEVFLWLMAVLTIWCASYWSAWRARDAAIEQDKLLKDASEEILNMKMLVLVEL